MFFDTLSNVTLQQIVDIAESFGDINPVLNVGGQSGQTTSYGFCTPIHFSAPLTAGGF